MIIPAGTRVVSMNPACGEEGYVLASNLTLESDQVVSSSDGVFARMGKISDAEDIILSGLTSSEYSLIMGRYGEEYRDDLSAREIVQTLAAHGAVRLSDEKDLHGYYTLQVMSHLPSVTFQGDDSYYHVAWIK